MPVTIVDDRKYSQPEDMDGIECQNQPPAYQIATDLEANMTAL